MDLRNDTKNLREVYIPDVSSIIYDTPDQDIKLEIEATNQISLISVKKFTSHDGTRFLVILTDGKETTERILSNRNITIYGDLLPAKRKYWPRKKHSNTTARSEENNTSHTTTPARNTNARSDSASALPPTSHWAGSRRPPTPTPAKHSDTLNFTTLKRQPRPSPSTYGTGHTNTPAPRPVTSSTTPSAPRPNQSPQTPLQSSGKTQQQPKPQKSGQQQSPVTQQQSRPADNINTIILACSKLSEGLQHPDIFVEMLNISLASSGHSPVHIPIDVINFSTSYTTVNTQQ